MEISIVNQTMELSQYQDKWFYDEKNRCWCLEDVIYMPESKVPMFQRLSIYAPKELLTAPGCFAESAKQAPVVFHNNAAGYMQMPHLKLEDPHCKGREFLDAGFVYITCGCSGRNSRDAEGNLVGKAPATLIDLKTAIRFLRHNCNALPGNYEKIISIGVSAGGAMSALLGVTGDHEAYLPYLKEKGAFLDESDAVYAAQIYCPIIDLEHADLAYEWMFHADKTCEDSHAGPSETMSPFKEALSAKLYDAYINYFNSLGLCDPQSGERLILNPDGRSGSGYEYLMRCLEKSATKYLCRLESTAEYLCANNKQRWLSWNGETVTIRDLDSYVLNHRRRMKPCTAFDTLPGRSGENHVFGTPEMDYLHFNPVIAQSLESMKDAFPEEYAIYHPEFENVKDDALVRRVYLFNPMNFIDQNRGTHAKHFRIRVGGQDADTSLTISMALALKLQNGGCGNVDYAIVWDQPHCDADYPGEFCDWIRKICNESKN